jgi:ubiquitin carboxyl-terminal hydrolase 4/11/15
MNLGTLEERLGGSTSTSHKSNPEYSNLKGDLQTLLSMTPRDPYTDLQKYSGPKGGSGRPLVGLTNLGNTCFMNSILQCIFSTSLLTNYFQTGMYKCDLNPQGGCKGQFGKVFADLVGEVFREEGGRVVAPRAFKRELEKWAPQFSGYRQQDSQGLIFNSIEVFELSNGTMYNRISEVHVGWIGRRLESSARQTLMENQGR